MSEERSVLLLGHSSVSYAETGPGDSICDRTEAELNRLAPGLAWHCRTDLLYMTPTMAARVETRLNRDSLPDAVVLLIGEMHFTRDYVVYRVRERWPRLFRGAVRIAQALTDLGGGGPEGAPSPRGWLFRGPRWLAAKLVGVAPDVRVEEAVALTKQTLDAFLRHEGMQVVFFFSHQAFPANVPDAEAARRRDLYIREISAYCGERMIPAVEQASLLRETGRQINLAADGWHEDADGRQLQASLFAQAVLQALEGEEVAV